jgi:hypothetical protein
MFVTFIRAENTKALINQIQLVASGMQGKTCLGKKLHAMVVAESFIQPACYGVPPSKM